MRSTHDHHPWRSLAAGLALASAIAAVAARPARAAEPMPSPEHPAATPSPRAPGGTLRVCADPNNLPFSNERGEGIENALATLVGRALGLTVAYTWQPQRRGFVRTTLNRGACD